MLKNILNRSAVCLFGLVGALSPRLGLAADPIPHSAATSSLTYDAQVLSMGGAGVALATSGAASVHNPALISQTNQRVATLTFTPYLIKLRAPFRYGNGKVVQTQSGLLFGPFVQLGMSVRLTKRLVVGMNGFITGAAGGTFTRVPLAAFTDDPSVPRGIAGNVRVGQFAGELQIPVSLQAAPWLSIAAAYRLTQAYTFANVSNVAGDKLADVAMRGTHLTGYAAGVLARVHPRWQLAASYRSQVIIDLAGTRTEYTEPVLKSSYSSGAGFKSPQQIRAGFTFVPDAHKKMLLAFEAHTELYQVIDKRERQTFGGNLGGQLALRDWLTVRAGCSVATQPLSDRHALQTAPPPGMGYSLTGGTGFHLRDWRLDAGVAYIISGKTVNNNATAGRYMAQGFIGSATASHAL